MDRIFFADFYNLLREYREPTTREDILIKKQLDSIVAHYKSCSVEEREFADEITREFSHIIVLLKNQHREKMRELSEKCQELENRQEKLLSTYIPLHRQDQGKTYKFDHEVLSAFYDHFKRPGDDQLSYRQIERYQFENEEQRRDLVNLTMWDYCNRIKTFAKKYLYEIYPDDSISRIIHGANAKDYAPPEPIVFVYNNLELILAKMKTTNENGETIKQRLNIRSALRKLNEFKREMESALSTPATASETLSWSDFETYAPAGYRYYVEKIMLELDIKDIHELEKRIDEAIDFCTDRIANASGDDREAHRYSNYRAVLRKYKEFMSSKKILP